METAMQKCFFGLPFHAHGPWPIEALRFRTYVEYLLAVVAASTIDYELSGPLYLMP